jgi:hypothetical protein
MNANQSNPYDEPPRFFEYVDFEPAPGSDDDGINPGILIRGFNGMAFALATVDEQTGVWYLARGASMGNPLRTRGTASVMTWTEPAQIREWVGRLPDKIKADMMRRQLFIVPVRLQIVFNGRFERITIRTRTVPATEEGAAPTVEYELGTAPLPLRRRRPKRRIERHDD